MNRARRAFWTLVVVAAIAMGALSKAVAAAPGPVTGAAVAASATVLALSIALAARIVVRLDGMKATALPAPNPKCRNRDARPKELG